MAADTETHAIHPRRIRRAALSESRDVHADRKSSHDYEDSRGNHEALFDLKRASHDVEPEFPNDSHKNKYNTHAELVPVRKESELGYFSTMSVTFSRSQSFDSPSSQ